MAANSQTRDVPTLPWDVLQHFDKVCMRFENAWQAGLKPQLADFLADTASGQRSALLCELLKIELRYRNLSGERVAVDSYLSQFPDDAEAIQAAFSTVKAPTV